jgi:hypothetical protein
MHSHLDAYLWLPLAITLAEWAVVLGVLHAAVGRSMRARGMAWRLRDTALVSPLLLVGVLLFFGSLNHGLERYAVDVVRGHAGYVHLAATIAAAGVGAVMAWFGGRAVGKLY